ncbi:MAG TPA: hypothetical protein VEC11_17855 [Allosphingosinicella sp.]|nr:hypothetical protein [Allosphingosinicella sp.]
MATSTIDGTVEEAVLRRRRPKMSVYDRILFRLDDGSTRTWAKAVVMNDVADLLTPGTRGRFYTFSAIDHRGISGVRTDDGREAFGFGRVNEYAGLGVFISMTLLVILQMSLLDGVSVWALVLAVLGLPLFLLYRQTRLDAEKAFKADAGFRPAARAA